METNNEHNDFLNQLKEKLGNGGFQVPANYFEKFDNKVQNQIKVKSSKWMMNSLKWMGGFSATAVAIVVVFSIFQNQKISEVSSEQYTAYLEERIDELTLDDFAESLTDEDLQEIEEDFEAESIFILSSDTFPKVEETEINLDEALEEISEDEIYEYLLEEEYENEDWDEL